MDQNRERDARNVAALEEIGFRVLVLWECELKHDGLEAAVEAVRSALSRA